MTIALRDLTVSENPDQEWVRDGGQKLTMDPRKDQSAGYVDWKLQRQQAVLVWIRLLNAVKIVQKTNQLNEPCTQIRPQKTGCWTAVALCVLSAGKNAGFTRK